MPGADGACGRYEFDPLGFSKKTELVPYFREAELKHGRLAMMAFAGAVTQAALTRHPFPWLF